MYIHITFEDGSSPYVMYGNRNQVDAEMERWKSSYYLIANSDQKPKDGLLMGYHVFAIAKQKPINLFDMSEVAQ